MVAWEKQIEERSVPEWRDKYVAYGRLKRKLEHIKQPEAAGSNHHEDALTRAAMNDCEWAKRISWTVETVEAAGAANPFLAEEQTQQKQDEFMQAVEQELVRVGEWYKDKVTALEARVRQLDDEEGLEGEASLSGSAGAEVVSSLHLEAVRLTEFVILNVEALRKIVKKMDKQCGTSYQKVFVEKSLKKSPLATKSSDQPFNGERARACRRALEELVSPERLQELRSQAMESGGVGLSTKHWSLTRTLSSICVALVALLMSQNYVPLPKAQRCFGLMIFTVVMWVSEAAPFEATAMLVAPLAAAFDVMEGTKEDQAKKLLASVFNESLFLVLSGFTMSSIFSKCQLDCRAAAVLQQSLGSRPFLFMLAIMLLGVGLSALLSNVTAPLLLVEVLKPLLRDMPTDSRYSRALLLGLAFACNVGGMMTPISSPQNVASLQALRQRGHDITWSEWLCLSIPFCTLAVLVAWLLLLLVYQFDLSESEASRHQLPGSSSSKIPAVMFEKEELSSGKLVGLLGAVATLAAYAYAPASQAFGGTSSVALLFVALSLGSGGISRQTFNSYNWHLLFLIGGGSALGLAVQESGLLDLLSDAIKRQLSSSPWLLVLELTMVIVGATTFVSHTVAALVLMPLVVQLGEEAGVERIAVLLGAFACSIACALPMTSFPNVNSLMAADDLGKPWLSVKNFLVAGIPTTIMLSLLLVTAGYVIGAWALS